jgi:hypothetical protein
MVFIRKVDKQSFFISSVSYSILKSFMEEAVTKRKCNDSLTGFDNS